MEQKDKKSKSAVLRLEAEDLLKKSISNPKDLYNEADTLKLFHELRVHQIELEPQNEELMHATKLNIK